MPCFYKDTSGKIVGPISTADARELVARNVIHRDTLIARTAAGPWVAASRLQGLIKDTSVPPTAPAQLQANSAAIRRRGPGLPGSEPPATARLPVTMPAGESAKGLAALAGKNLVVVGCLAGFGALLIGGAMIYALMPASQSTAQQARDTSIREAADTHPAASSKKTVVASANGPAISGPSNPTNKPIATSDQPSAKRPSLPKPQMQPEDPRDSTPSDAEMQTKGLETVEKYMTLLCEKGKESVPQRMRLLSQKYLLENNVDAGEFALNDYAFQRFEVLGVARDTITIRGSHSNGWSHIVSFKLVKENSDLVILPVTVRRKGDEGALDNYVYTCSVVKEFDERAVGRVPKRELVDATASRKLKDNLVRVARGSETDPGWAVQAAHRLLRAEHLAPASPLGRLIDAYQRGVGEWSNSDGTTERMSSLGLPDCDWRSTKFMAAYAEDDPKREPFVHVEREADGTRATLSPIEITEDLLCSISFLVIDNTPKHARAAGLDFLAVQVMLYGGKLWRLDTSPVMQPDTFVDLWSSTRNRRYTITRWKPDQPAGHMTVQTYGPLLFEVLNNEPDFMFVENVKIELSPRFRDGCRQLCGEVLALREKQGQGNPPECRNPSE